jgi:hypothetical protein
LVHIELINGHVVNNRPGGFKRRISKYIGAPLILQVVLLIFSMIDSVLGLLVGNANEQIGTINRRDITHHNILEMTNRKGK